MFLTLFLFVSFAGLPLEKAQVKSKDGEWIYIYNHHPSESDNPPPLADEAHLSPDSVIFVSLASLHDPRCGRTMYDFLTHAEYPERIQFGVVAQDRPDTPDCVDTMCALFQGKEMGDKPDPDLPCPYKDNVRIMRLKDEEAKGPVFARALVHAMMDDIPPNSFCLTLDAHSFSIDNWDVEILKEWGATKNEMAVLTTYIGGIESLGKNVMGMHEVPHLCEGDFHNGFPANTRATAARWLGAPILAPLWAAGLSFSKCHAEIRVPNDPNLPYLWEGEEFGRSARLWTNGYDLYTPSQNILAHDWIKYKEQKKWYQRPLGELKESELRLKSILLYPESNQDPSYKKSLGNYDLGTKRTLNEYSKFCGTDTETQEIAFDYCVDFEWVPWTWKESEIESYRSMTWTNEDPTLDPYLSRISRYGPDAGKSKQSKRMPSSTRSLLQAEDDKTKKKKKSKSKSSDIQRLESAINELERKIESPPTVQDLTHVIEDLNRRIHEIESGRTKIAGSEKSSTNSEELGDIRRDIVKQRAELQKQNAKIAKLAKVSAYRNETLQFASLKYEGDVTIRWLVYIIMALGLLCFNGWLCCILSRYMGPTDLKRA